MKLVINRLKEFDAGRLISHTYLMMKQDFSKRTCEAMSAQPPPGAVSCPVGTRQRR
jgi:hypothetical protein